MINVENAFRPTGYFIVQKIKKYMQKYKDVNAKVYYCKKCGDPFYLSIKDYTHNLSCGSYNDKNLCEKCDDKRYGWFYHEYRTNGKQENIEDAERIKIVICKTYNNFGLTCYIDLNSLAGSGRTAGLSSNNEKEIIFEKNYKANMVDIQEFDDFKNDILKYSKRAKIPGKKALLANINFIKYLYECLKHSINVGIDKHYITLINGL